MEYRNLLERAKPELLKALAQTREKYPTTADMVEKELKQTIGVSFLPYGVICDLRSMIWGIKGEFDINNPWKLFEDR